MATRDIASLTALLTKTFTRAAAEKADGEKTVAGKRPAVAPRGPVKPAPATPAPATPAPATVTNAETDGDHPFDLRA